MKRMRRFLTTLGVVWIAAGIAAYFYSQQQHIPWATALAVLPAFLIEIAFYLAPGFPEIRERADRAAIKSPRALLLSLSALLPYLAISLALGSFSRPLALIAAILVASFWYVGSGPGVFNDLLFLGFMAAIYLSKLFDQAYGHLNAHIALGILGKLMWIRLGLMEVFSLRGMEDVKFGFIPEPREWRIGALFFAAFLPVGGVVAYLLRLGSFHPQPYVWWKFLAVALGTFLAMLWVVALAEEFFFRAFLQGILTQRLKSGTAGLITASVLFGLAHLPYRAFPNWRYVAVATVLGLFCGLAMQKAGSVRASMVTHALVVVTWRMLFTG
jgi:membrane protease YdiL (CAAX protease family)